MALPQDHVKALDQLRNRLSQLSLSVSSLRSELERSEPLPSWPSLQSTAQILGYNLQQVAETMGAHRQLLASLHAYPLPSFPGHTHEVLAQQLLRKKLDPRAEDWIDRHSAPAAAAAEPAPGEAARLKFQDVKEIWDWAGPTSNSMLRRFVEDGVFDDDYTIAEREDGVENVVTGLRRKLDEDDEDVEILPDRLAAEVEGSSAEKVPPLDLLQGVDPTKPALPLDALLKFATVGDLGSGTKRS